MYVCQKIFLKLISSVCNNKKQAYINLEMHVALDTWGMADICGIAVDLYVKHALGVNDMVANNCCG
jgi:hypothetical protein